MPSGINNRNKNKAQKISKYIIHSNNKVLSNMTWTGKPQIWNISYMAQRVEGTEDTVTCSLVTVTAVLLIGGSATWDTLVVKTV
jgi:hypothetical protein